MKTISRKNILLCGILSLPELNIMLFYCQLTRFYLVSRFCKFATGVDIIAPMPVQRCEMVFFVIEKGQQI